MTEKNATDKLLHAMPEERLSEVSDFGQFLNLRDEADAWRRFGQSQLARAYGANEPEYTMADWKPELFG
jgi:hypothetical protein